jgi:uncharacterized protein (DUF1800 family)
MRIIILLPFLLFLNTSQAQYDDYIGAGHNSDITITSSSELNGTSADNLINGKGLDNKYFEASRFLAQATNGYEKSHIQDVLDMGFEAWIDNQMNLPASLTMPKMEEIWQEEVDIRVANGENEEEIFGPFSVHFNYAWWTINMTNQDLLRQRIAYSLSQIFVISENSDLGGMANSMCDFYDILIDNAFGNYKDILMDVTLHPSMGYYLSHLNNPKEIPEDNIHPDENYAREIMQLFTIGLYQLNNDGTQVLDTNGDPIPTYDNADIKELAKVFTGLGAGDIEDFVTWTDEPYFGLGFYGTHKTTPMIMYQDFHETSDKDLINDFNIPANQDGMIDIEMAIDNLMNHQNTPPFVALRLIQRLVTSNPTAAYVGRVAEKFIDNGQGVRGDLKAVVKAILLDPEARTAEAMLDPSNGRLREPFLRYSQFSRIMPKNSNEERYWNNGVNFFNATKQHVLFSPTVFNFYTFDHQPVGEIADNNLVAPEYKIHNTSTSIGYINSAFVWLFYNSLMYDWLPNDWIDNDVSLNLSELEAISDNTEILINELDRILTHGQLTDETRQIMRDHLNPVYWTWDQNWRGYRTRIALYLLLMSPDYNVMK